MDRIRKNLFEIIEVADEKNSYSGIYDACMMAVIVISLIPLAFKETNPVFEIIDKASAVVFALDYLARILTADLKLGRGPVSFVIYPFTPMAIIDLLVILPSFTPLAAGWRLMKLFRLFRTFRVFRSFKLLRYSKALSIILDVIRTQREPLIAVCSMAIGYVLISALIIFNIEPETFGTFFDSVYWAAVSLTTVGYGDIYPVSTAGRIVTIVSQFVGIAIVAMPAGIITAGYMDKINEKK